MGEAENGPTTVDIAEFLYEPEDLSIAVGTEVTWVNFDEAPHTATADDSSFDTEKLELDDEAAITFDEAGEYPYYCRFHPFMRATVEVR